MQLDRRVTIFVVGCLTYFALSVATANAAKPVKSDPDSPVSFSFKLGGESSLAPNASVSASTGSSLEYNFFKSYAVGVEYSLLAPFTQFDDYVYNGSNDASFYLKDNKLWENKYYGLSVTARVSLTLPVSSTSQQASINWASGESMVFKKEFSDREFISYTVSSTQYSVEHNEAYIDPDDGTIYYNTRFDANNRLTYSITPLKGFTVLLGAGAKLYYNYNDNYYWIYRLATAASLAVSKSGTVDVTITNFMKNSENDKTWAGPVSNDRFFDGRGTWITLSFTLKI